MMNPKNVNTINLTLHSNTFHYEKKFIQGTLVSLYSPETNLLVMSVQRSFIRKIQESTEMHNYAHQAERDTSYPLFNI